MSGRAAESAAGPTGPETVAEDEGRPEVNACRLVLLPETPGVTITDDMVADALDESV